MRFIHWTGTRPQILKGSLINTILKSIGAPYLCVSSWQHHDQELYQKDISHIHTHYVYPSEDKSDVVIVEGDTRTALEGALWAHQSGAKLVHIEAGCRAYADLPEEHNRVIIDHLATHRYCVSEHEQNNCLKEGLPIHTTRITGDLTWALFQSVTPEPVKVLPHTILMTMHRADVTPDKVRLVLATLRNYGNVIFPAHPKVYPWVKDEVGVIPGVSYPVLRGYLESCDLVATDSGGLCREAYMANKPCVILRPHTEWQTLVDLGRHRITGTDIPTLCKALEDSWPKRTVNPEIVFGEDPMGFLTKALQEDFL